MDLAEYEKTKFELAEILRSAVIESARPMSEAPDEIRSLLSRLAEDRFNLVVVGRFNRGKTSLMNALLGTTRLPTGIVPLTSVITVVSYGPREEVSIEYQGSRLPYRVSLEHLTEYVTQHGNPGNEKNVAAASVRLPCELLRRGFHFVDTPGIGSAIRENTVTTERFLPEADAFVLVSSYDSPLSEEEAMLLRRIVPTGKKVFFILNKQDIVSGSDQKQVRQYARSRLGELFGACAPDVFSVSALRALETRTSVDIGNENGVAALRDHLVTFLISEKQGRFLANMSDRIAATIRELPNSSLPLARMNELLQRLQRKDGSHRPDTPVAGMTGEMHISTCLICDSIEHDVFSALAKFQYDIAFNEAIRADLAERGGLCPFHTWQYDALASPVGTCLGFSMVLDRLASRLRKIENPLVPRIEQLRVPEERCPICLVRAESERQAVMDLKTRLVGAPSSFSSLPSLCLAHVDLIIRELKDSAVARHLLVHQAEIYERLSEDMRRYALKIDGVRRHLTNDEEHTAANLALNLLAGSYEGNALTHSAKLRNGSPDWAWRKVASGRSHR